MGAGDAKALKPDGGMQMWYYRCPRIFRYPIPTNFEFAYINKSGELAITGPFCDANSFTNGAAVVSIGSYKLDGGKWQCGDLTYRGGQKVILTPTGDVAFLAGSDITQPFFDEFAVAYINRTAPGERIPEVCYELVDKTGKIVTGFNWKTAQTYSDGLVAVKGEGPTAYRVSPGVIEHSAERILGLQGQGWGYRHRPTIFDEAGSISARDWHLFVKRAPTFRFGNLKDPRFYHQEEYTYIDKTGKVVIEGPFMEAQAFVNGLAAVMQGGKWGYIDKAGKIVVPCQYDWAGDFTSKLAPVEKDQLVGYIDATGKVIIPFRYKDGREFAEGLAPITLDGRSWGFIDDAGKPAIAPKFQRAFPFNSGLALVYIDPRKEIIPTPQDAQFFLASAMDERAKGNLNEARAGCKAVIDAAPNSNIGCQSQKHALGVRCPIMT